MAAAICMSCRYDVEDNTRTLTLKVKAPASFAGNVAVLPLWLGSWSGNGTYTFTSGDDGYSYITIPVVYPYSLENVSAWGVAPSGANFAFHFKYTDWAFAIGCTGTGNGDNNFLVKLSEKNGALDKDQTILVDVSSSSTTPRIYDPHPLNSTPESVTFYDVSSAAVYVDGVVQVP
jgi:hypothetical protein